MRVVNGVEVLTTLEELVYPPASAVLVIDMQNHNVNALSYEEPGFDRTGTQVSNLAPIVPRIQRLLAEARRTGVRVTYAEWIDRSREGVPLVNGPHLYCHRDDADPPNVIEGSWDAQTIDSLAPQAGDLVIRKSWSSAFHHTGLDDYLRQHQIKCLLIAGCITGGCVLKTAVDASHHDYYPVIIRDCVGSYNRESHELALTWLETKFPVFDLDDVLTEWQRIAIPKG
jgi:nicotinamidase-related amidase